MKKLFVRSTLAVAALALMAGIAPTAQAGEPKGTKEATGVIVSVDEKAGTVSVRQKDNVMTFTAAPDVKFGHAGEKVKGMTISDLKIGDKVTVHYRLEGDKAIAHKFAKVENTNKEMKKEK